MFEIGDAIRFKDRRLLERISIFYREGHLGRISEMTESKHELAVDGKRYYVLIYMDKEISKLKIPELTDKYNGKIYEFYCFAGGMEKIDMQLRIF